MRAKEREQHSCQAQRRFARRRVLPTLAVLAFAFLALAATASAAAPELVLQMPSGTVAPGEGAGELNWPVGIVGKSSGTNKGHVYIADQSNNRIVEYTAWGSFVKAWGWGVDGGAELETCGPAVPEAEPQTSLCRQGTAGGGKGQFNRPRGLAIDPAGNIYAFEEANFRVQKFSPSGEFLVMFGGDVNKTKVEEGAPVAERNRCPVAPNDVCQAGTSGTGPGSFGLHFFDQISYSPAENAIVVGDIGRIEEFNLDGTLKSEVPFEGALEPFEGKSVTGLDVDAAGDIYMSVEGLEDVYKLSPTGEPLDPGKPAASRFTVENPGGVTVDPAGDVYAIGSVNPSVQGFPGNLERSVVVSEFSAAGEKLVPTTEEEARYEVPKGNYFQPQMLFPYTAPLPSFGIATDICAGSEAPGNLYISTFVPNKASFVNAYGTPPAGCEPPPPAPPTITGQFAASAGADFARLRAKINPHFWDDTTYHLEYGTGRCSEGGCANRAPLIDARLTGKVVNVPVTTETITLSGLHPATTYHYRFVAGSGGGGPVYGTDRDGEGGPGQASQAEGVEGTFRTSAVAGPAAPCSANEAFRTGPGAALPDCRAYELVSPLEKQGGSPGLLPGTKTEFEVDQSAGDGDRVTYSAMTAFADPGSAPYISQYLSSRDPGSGWSTSSISPPRSTRTLDVLHSLTNEFKAFSPDLCQAWLVHNSDSTLAPGAIPGYSNLYRRSNCQGAAAYEALTTVRPPERDPSLYILNPLGSSADGSESAFVAEDRLTPDAPSLRVGIEGSNESELLLYVEGPAGLRYACYLPSGAPSQTECSAGMTAGKPGGKASAVQNALSADGSRLYWTAYEGADELVFKGVPGRIYLSIDPDQAQSARLDGSGAGKGDLAGPAFAKCNANKNALTVSACQWASGEFGPGQEVSGPCIAAETTVVSVVRAEARMTLSKKPSATQTECEITGAASAVVRNVTGEFGEFAPGQEFIAPGVQPGTTIESVGAGTLTLSAQATQTTTGAAIEATSPCTEAGKACTLPVSGAVTPERSEFWAASRDGSRALFRVAQGPLAGNLYEYDLATRSATLIAEGAEAPLGVSEDASRVYFSSTEVLGQGGAEGAVAGAHNLYLHEAGGGFHFIMRLTEADLGGSEQRPGAVNAVPTRRSSALSADGAVATFVSTASPTPTGYDNTDAASGLPDQEVYRYEAAGRRLSCISCNPTGARPLGETVSGAGNSHTGMAARLPQQHAPLVVPHPLSADGNRLFFESYEALVPRDTNGTWDVYEWEAAGTGSCTGSSSTYNPENGGCVDLISSGTSPQPSRFLAADESGANVFIGTFAGLVRADYGLYDVYDARVGGGFPEPPGQPAACEGEACQGPPSPPNDATPASAGFQGPGNVREGAKKKKAGCPKGKVRKGRAKKGRKCVKRHRKAHHRKHHHQRHQKKANPDRRAHR